jgi:two-component system chemotaxis response regulator CheY
MPMKVLIVDDDVVSRMMLMHLVDTCGSFEILEAEDGEDAWRQLEAGLGPSICFCDLRMPRLSGMELLARVRADARMTALPFVLVSGANEHETVEQASGLGASGYIVKPFKAGQVREYLAALGAPQAQGAAREAAGDDAAGDEAPAVTARRLGIDAPRLLLYLGGLHRQLSAAGAEIEQLLACGDGAGAAAALARLGQGCTTLGLQRAAAELAALEALVLAAPVAPDADSVTRALDAARGAALGQGELARALCAAS